MKLFEQIKTKNIQEMAEFMCDNFDCGICPAFDANYCANANLMFSSKAMKRYLESECEIKCGNCEHYKPIEKYTGYCILHNLPAHETGTCREGKKKDSGQTLLDLKDGGKGGGIAIGKLAQPLEAGTDLNELKTGEYIINSKTAAPQPFYSDPEECKKAVEFLRAAGYNAVTNGNIILVKPKQKEAQT